MLSRRTGGVQLLISSLNSVCWAKASSASVIFHTSSHSDFTLCFFDLSIKILPPPLSADFFFSFVPILGFGSCASPALVGFFSPDCDFLVVIVSVASLSCNFVRDFSSDLLLQLHLVVVYCDVAARGHFSTAV